MAGVAATPGATDGTLCAKELAADTVDAQMAATLTFTALGTGSLAGVAGFVFADGATANVIGAGAFATGPTVAATRLTVLAATVGAGVKSASFAEDVVTRFTAQTASLVNDVPVAAEHQFGDRLCTDFAGGAAQRAGVAVAGDLNGALLFAVAKTDLRIGHRHMDEGIAEEAHLDA